MKCANDMLQPPMPPPAPAARPAVPSVLEGPKVPTPPNPGTAFGGGNWFNPQTALSKGFDALKSIAPSGYQTAAAVTENTPPLQMMTHHLPESFQGPANSVLGFAQKGLQKFGPGGFAGIMGGVAPGLTKGLLSTPAGLPVLTGLHGLLRGGESFAAAKTLFNPLLKRIGVG